MHYPFEIPKLKDDSSVHNKCYACKPKDMHGITLPEERVPNWKEEAINIFDELLHHYKELKVFMDSCVRCGNCAAACQFFLGTGDPKNMPVARAELMRKVYRKYFTVAGKLFPNSEHSEELSEELLEEWRTYFYQCSECRRCSVFCPYGIDTAQITMAAREIMARIGVATKYVTEVVHKVYNTGNNLGIWPEAWEDSSLFLEEELKEETGHDIKLPVDEKGAEVLLVMPSADNFANVDTMMGYAKMFYAAGISWTTSVYADEGGNFGMFLNYANQKRVNQRIVVAAKELGVKRIIWGECGHAWRAGFPFTNTFNAGMSDFDPPYPLHICEFTYNLMKKGAFKIDKSANDDVKVTFHDPCNVARGSNATLRMGMFEWPRAMVRMTCNNFVEMHKDTIREKTYCCGGGGGMLADEIMELRMAGGKPRAEACRATGANYLATPCAICKANLPEVMQHHKVPVVVGGIHDLLSKALIL
ncbi:sulfate reduction electron transfer complex DsrMKJOP subunit DsrK [candidate division KSB1 bacterium]